MKIKSLFYFTLLVVFVFCSNVIKGQCTIGNNTITPQSPGLFCESGDKIEIDTRTGEYRRRV